MGGWRLDAGQTHSIINYQGWTSGRFWGRTECTFDNSGAGSCATGDCGGHLQCNGAGGVPPASLAEVYAQWRQEAMISMISVMWLALIFLSSLLWLVTPSPSRILIDVATAGCPTDMNATCPSELQKKDAGGKVVGCMSPCEHSAHDSIVVREPLPVRRRVIPPNGLSIMHRSSRKHVHRLIVMPSMIRPALSCAAIATTRLPLAHSALLLITVLEIPCYQSIRAGLPLLRRILCTDGKKRFCQRQSIYSKYCQCSFRIFKWLSAIQITTIIR